MILIPKYSNTIEIEGALSLILTDTEKNIVKQEMYVPNIVVYDGKKFIASRMLGTTYAAMTHIGIGTSSTAETAGGPGIGAGDTALGAELTVAGGYTAYSRAALTVSSATNNTVTYSANFPANNPSAPAGGAVLREAGIFNAATAGTMLCRTTFPTVTKLPADALTVTWTITIS
jgi:hypothetical protein